MNVFLLAEPFGSAVFLTADITRLFCAGLAVMSVITFVLFGIDKCKAKKRAWRVSELTLLVCSFLLGAPGGFLGMLVFRHKTKKPVFNITVPFLAILYTAFLAFLIA